MLAAFDPPPPSAFPASPTLTGSRNPLSVNLNWTVPAEGASPITGYNLERAENSGSFRLLAKLTATATKYEDTTAIAASSMYQYRVAAVNLNGTGTPSNVVAPPLPTENICIAPGLSVLKDGTGDTVSVITILGQPVGAPVPAAADLTLLTVGEPYLAGGQLSMIFQLKTASTDGTLPPDSTWFTSFRNAANVAYAVRMVTDSTGVPRFEAYKVKADSNGNYRGDFVDGTPTPALPGSGYAPATGVITIVVRASDIGVTAAGQSITSLLSISSKLAVVLSQPLDLMPDNGVGTGSVQTVAVSQCGPNHAPVPVLSASPIGQRKNLNVHFDASRSYDPDASSTDPQLRDAIVKYVFDFGDGTAPVASTTPTIDHQYQSGGQYGATLRVQDSRGKASDNAAVKQICDKCLK
jgi:hypothetical protein